MPHSLAGEKHQTGSVYRGLFFTYPKCDIAHNLLHRPVSQDYDLAVNVSIGGETMKLPGYINKIK